MAKPHKRKGFIAQFGHLKGADKVAESLGNMTAAWSFLENQLALTFARLSGLDEERAYATMYALNATSSRIAVAQQLNNRLPDDDAFRLQCDTILRATIALTSRRNSLTHHLWTVDIDTRKAYTFDYRKAPDTQGRRQRRTPKSIDAFTVEILEVCQQYANLLGQNIQREDP